MIHFSLNFHSMKKFLQASISFLTWLKGKSCLSFVLSCIIFLILPFDNSGLLYSSSFHCLFLTLELWSYWVYFSINFTEYNLGMISGTLLKYVIHWVLTDVKWRYRSFPSPPNVPQAPPSISSHSQLLYWVYFTSIFFQNHFWCARHLTLVWEARRRWRKGDGEQLLFQEKV